MNINEETLSLQQQFEELISLDDKLRIQDFLNHQHISDVATLIDENEAFECQIIGHLSLHRATSVFKILDLPTQKRIIKNLPAFKTAELLNELPADDRTAFLSELPSNVVRELIKNTQPRRAKKSPYRCWVIPKAVWGG